jgi:hypothetical protein
LKIEPSNCQPQIPDIPGELKYKAYHLSLMTIETMIERKLPFLLPFIVESELKSLDESSTNRSTRHLLSLQQQIDQHEEELNQMIDGLTTEQMDSLRTSVEYLWGKSYSKEMFNKSTLLTLMRKQLDFRQADIQRGRTEGLKEGRTVGLKEGQTVGQTKAVNAAKRMLQDGKMNRQQLEEFLNYMKQEDEKKQ